jgi:hypothetical protein
VTPDDAARNAVIDQLLAQDPEFAELRRQRLADPGWCARNDDLADLYDDPTYIAGVVAHNREMRDPFSKLRLEREDFRRLLRAGAAARLIDGETGEVLEEFPERVNLLTIWEARETN